MNIRRNFLFALAALTAFSIIVAAPSTVLAASGHYAESSAPVIGKLSSKGRVRLNTRVLNAQTAKNGVALKSCVVIQTLEKPAVVKLASGGFVFIKANSIAQICEHAGESVVVHVPRGGAELVNVRLNPNWMNTLRGWLEPDDLPTYLTWINTPFTGAISGGGNSGTQTSGSTGGNPNPNYPNPI